MERTLSFPQKKLVVKAPFAKHQSLSVEDLQNIEVKVGHKTRGKNNDLRAVMINLKFIVAERKLLGLDD